LIHSYIDIFVSTEALGEPGPFNYAIKTNRFTTGSKSVVIPVDSPIFCLNCTFYIAVEGYNDNSQFLLTASSQGITMLHSGKVTPGVVRAKQLVYYSFFNLDPLADISVSLTMLAGDADLYMTAFRPSAGGGGGGADKPSLPTRSSYTWHSVHIGDDLIAVDYNDPHFCTGCDFIVGVYGI
jgi:hypothetical protein